MKTLLRKIFAPILNTLEAGDEPYAYKPSARKILIIMGVLFSCLASFIFLLAQGESKGYLFPVLIFGSMGLLSILVGYLGTDRAVAKIWGSR